MNISKLSRSAHSTSLVLPSKINETLSKITPLSSDDKKHLVTVAQRIGREYCKFFEEYNNTKNIIMLVAIFSDMLAEITLPSCNICCFDFD